MSDTRKRAKMCQCHEHLQLSQSEIESFSKIQFALCFVATVPIRSIIVFHSFNNSLTFHSSNIFQCKIKPTEIGKIHWSEMQISFSWSSTSFSVDFHPSIVDENENFCNEFFSFLSSLRSWNFLTHKEIARKVFSSDSKIQNGIFPSQAFPGWVFMM